MAKVDQSKPLYREFSFDRAAVNEKDRTVALSFSSETPVDRWFGKEILSHEAGAVDLSMLRDGAPLLLDHDTRKQIGVVDSAEVGADKKGRAVVRFGRSALAEEIFQDVKDGIRSKVSVGYRISKMEESDDDGDGEMETCRATRWTPLEISLVSMPADNAVGVGRSESTETSISRKDPMNTPAPAPVETRTAPPAPAPAPAPAAAPAAPAIVRSETDIRKDEQNRAKEIFAIATRFHNQVPTAVEKAQTAVLEGASVEAFRSQIMDLLAAGGPSAPADVQIVPAGRSLGELFVASEAYRGVSNKGGKRQATFELPYDPVLNRATGTSTGLTSIDKQPGIVLLNQMPLRIGDLITQTPTQNTTIRYISENSFNNAAAFVAEEGQKPEAAWDLVETDAIVRKIAVVGRVTDEFFADYAATRDYVNSRLQYMVGAKEDNALLNGTGNANQIKGILNFAGIQTQALGANTVPDAIYKAITKVRTVGFFEPDAIVMNPADFQNVKLMKDNNGQYYYAGPNATTYGQPAQVVDRLWGLPVIWTTVIAQGTALVGAFRLAAQIFRRQGMTVETTNSDANDFQYNRIAIRAETRLGLAVFRPLAFCTVTGLPAVA